jgi:hypothetical protein
MKGLSINSFTKLSDEKLPDLAHKLNLACAFFKTPEILDIFAESFKISSLPAVIK